MTDTAKRVHRALFGFHNGELAHQYASAARALATESRALSDELFAFQRHYSDPLSELIRIQHEKNIRG